MWLRGNNTLNILERIEIIIKGSDTYLTEEEIYDIICKDVKVGIRYFLDCMNLLESIGKIMVDRDNMFNAVYWVGVDNPKLEKLMKESVRVR